VVVGGDLRWFSVATCVGGAVLSVGMGSVDRRCGRQETSSWEERDRREKREGRNEREREGRVGVWGAGPHDCGMNSAGLRSEAQFELLSSAWLRALICMRWAVLSSPEPTYQTTRCVKFLYELRIPGLDRSAKHTLRFCPCPVPILSIQNPLLPFLSHSQEIRHPQIARRLPHLRRPQPPRQDRAELRRMADGGRRTVAG
jgi:hypothetical protein